VRHQLPALSWIGDVALLDYRPATARNALLGNYVEFVWAPCAKCKPRALVGQLTRQFSAYSI
jgi:hypothetical protein